MSKIHEVWNQYKDGAILLDEFFAWISYHLADGTITKSEVFIFLHEINCDGSLEFAINSNSDLEYPSTI